VYAKLPNGALLEIEWELQPIKGDANVNDNKSIGFLFGHYWAER
jgi:hypothetical protein